MQDTRQPGISADYAATHGPTGEDLSVLAALRSLVSEASSLAHDHLHLAVLEAQRAGRNLVQAVIAGILAAVLVVTAWLALVAAGVAWWVDSGASWAQALVVAAIINVLIAVALAFWIRKLGQQLLFAVTLRWLRPGHRDENKAHPQADPVPPAVATGPV
jgi:uncharacterized membrane protein YqjE